LQVSQGTINSYRVRESHLVRFAVSVRRTTLRTPYLSQSEDRVLSKINRKSDPGNRVSVWLSNMDNCCAAELNLGADKP